MKTAISIPDALFKQAEVFARKQKVTRSSVYATALKMYLAAQDESCLGRKLHDYYDSEDSTLEPGVKGQQARTLHSLEW